LLSALLRIDLHGAPGDRRPESPRYGRNSATPKDYDESGSWQPRPSRGIWARLPVLHACWPDAWVQAHMFACIIFMIGHYLINLIDYGKKYRKETTCTTYTALTGGPGTLHVRTSSMACQGESKFASHPMAHQFFRARGWNSRHALHRSPQNLQISRPCFALPPEHTLFLVRLTPSDWITPGYSHWSKLATPYHDQ